MYTVCSEDINHGFLVFSTREMCIKVITGYGGHKW